MNKLDTLNKLNKIASVLENNGNVKEAEILTDVMIKLSQTGPFKMNDMNLYESGYWF
jgi:flagellar hook-basal body complex protein FliE